MAGRQHPHIATLKDDLSADRISRREFVRMAALLGVAVPAAYHMAGLAQGAEGTARAEELPRGGRLRISMQVTEISTPHTVSLTNASNLIRQSLEYLTVTGQDNITRPFLLESWTASDDLRTWTLQIRRDVTWRSGRAFTADDVVWNLRRVLDPATGSSVLGLMKAYMIEERETGEVDAAGKKVVQSMLWSDNAIEKLDDFTLRLNLRVPQVAIPEHLFHYPLVMMDPEEGGAFGVGANGTGPFALVEFRVGEKALFRASESYWNGRAFLDELEFLDHGDDAPAALNALEGGQVDGLYELSPDLLPRVKAMGDAVTLYAVDTAQTIVFRMRADTAPFDDPRVRLAMKLAVDVDAAVALTLSEFGSPGDDTHVSPIHPERAPMAPVRQDIERAKQLLAEAGFPNGFETEIATIQEPRWQLTLTEALVVQWNNIGVRVAINLMPSPMYWDSWTQFPFGATLWQHRPLGIMVLGLAYRSGVPWNESHYSNPEFDRLLAEAEGLLDVEKRRAVMAQLQDLLRADGPIVQPVWQKVATVYGERVLGFRMHPSRYIFGQELALGT